MSSWNIFSNHGHVLLYLARDPGARLRDVAANVGITERAVQKIVRDMQDAGVVSVSKVGRRNRYAITTEAALRHPLEAHCQVGQVVDLVLHTPGAPQPVDVAAEAASPPAEVIKQVTPARQPVAAALAPQAAPPEPPNESGKEARPGKARKMGKAKGEPDQPSAEQGSLF